MIVWKEEKQHTAENFLGKQIILMGFMT